MSDVEPKSAVTDAGGKERTLGGRLLQADEGAFLFGTASNRGTATRQRVRTVSVTSFPLDIAPPASDVLEHHQVNFHVVPQEDVTHNIMTQSL